MLRNTADKFLRVGGESGEKYDITTQQFTDIPSPSAEDSKKLFDVLSDKGLYHLVTQQDGNENLTYDQYKDFIDRNDDLKSQISSITTAGKFVFDTPVGETGTGYATGLVNGGAMGALIYGELNKAFGGAETTELDDKGGKGHVRRETNISIGDLNPEQQQVFMDELDEKGVEYNKNWNTVGESYSISEEWQSPKHTSIQKDMKKRFFDPKDIAPEYPKKNPEPMNSGYKSKSALAPKKLSRDPVIKLTKKDLSRNHRLTKKEVQDMMDTINKINKFLDANPAELIHARIRYPKDDPRLAELNWKLDQQLSASNEYLEKRFPENKQQTARVKKILAKNIELTDPKTFKSVKQPVTYEKMFKGEDPNKRVRLKDNSKKSPARFFKKENKTDTSRIKWLGGHVDINRVKELNEEKKERERIAELKKQQEIFHAEMSRLRKEKNKHYDWRTGKDLTEGMTTDALIPVTLDATGDVDLVGLGHETPNPLVQPGAENNNGTYTFGPVDLEYGYASTLSFTRTIDLSQVDTVVFDFTAGDITDFEFAVNASFYYLSTSSGSKVITLKQSDKVKNAYMSWIVYKNRGEPVGTNRISGVALQRRAPMNVFVGLDDPEASAFIRDTLDSQSLSPDEKKKKLEEQLGAGADYLVQMYGEGIFTGATEISDTELQQSFADIAQGLPYTDEDDAFDNPYYTDPVPDLDDDSDFDPDTFEYAGDSGTEIAGANYPYGTPGMEAPYTHTRPMMIDVDGKQKKINVDDKTQWPSILKKAQGTSAMVAHYEPQGKVIKEKKTLKDITKKIPGYYDGKPAPLGFPLADPPKMKDGMHPDLVDGKKTAKRFNKLDPVSAKAMPKTGNPLIDKKVKAAAKKPK